MAVDAQYEAKMKECAGDRGCQGKVQAWFEGEVRTRYADFYKL